MSPDDPLIPAATREAMLNIYEGAPVTPVELCTAIDAAVVLLREKYGIHQEFGPVEIALREVLQLADEEDLSQRSPEDPREIAELVSKFNFAGLHPVTLEQIEVEEKLDPEVFDLLYREQTIRSNGEVWRIHRNDADPFPHIVHAHSMLNGLKLDLRNGDVFKKRKKVGRIHLKHLNAIRARVTHPDLPELAPELREADEDE